jgi:hypothetical protein
VDLGILSGLTVLSRIQNHLDLCCSLELLLCRLLLDDDGPLVVGVAEVAEGVVKPGVATLAEQAVLQPSWSYQMLLPERPVEIRALYHEIVRAHLVKILVHESYCLIDCWEVASRKQDAREGWLAPALRPQGRVSGQTWSVEHQLVALHDRHFRSKSPGCRVYRALLQHWSCTQDVSWRAECPVEPCGTLTTLSLTTLSPTSLSRNESAQ